MRRFTLLIAAVVLMDTSLYAALTPLLPHYAHRFGLSQAGAGVLAACYGAGVLASALPTGLLAARIGPKRAVLGGLVLVAAASVAFAFAGDPWTMGAARVAQGIGSSATWAGGLTWVIARTPPERRGQAIGTVMGAAVFGALVGPVLGGIADFAGARATFSGFAVAVIATALVAARQPGVAAEPQPLRAALRLLGDRRLLAGLWLVILPSLIFGTFAIVVAFRLDDHGWRSSAIAAVFLAAAAGETVLNPLLGRLVDRRGHRAPVHVALVLSVGFALALAWARSPFALVPLAVVGALAFGAFYSPGMALISSSAERAGLAQAIAWGVMNGAWAAGNVIGPAAAGGIAHAASDAVPWLICAGLCAATFLVLRSRRGRAAAAVTVAALALAGVASAATTAPAAPARWQPTPGLLWQFQLSGAYDPRVVADVVEVDGADTPAATVAAIRKSGRKAVCYVSAGSWEDWRADAARFPKRVLGKPLAGWPGERWLDVRRLDVLLPILRARVAGCAAKGFHAVDFDNVDGYANATGFPLAAADQLRFNRALAALAHSAGLAVGLKNDLDQIPQLVADFDWATNEQCFEYDECTLLAPFPAAGKPAVVIEYTTPTARFCPQARLLGLDAMRKKLNLGAWREACPRAS